MSAVDQQADEQPATPTGDDRGRRAVKWAVLLVLALLWIRVVLFAWLFPLIERHVDNPEFDEETPTQVESPAGG